jgi:asparagine N-glycosylation enzyme membrane subunit Stt3
MNDEQPSVDRSEPPDHDPRTSGTLRLFIPVFALAALVRAIPWQYVLTSDGASFRDGDSYSHMWRIWNAASKSIPLSARDPFVNFPDGGEVLWSPAFDWILAVLVRGLGLDQSEAEILCAWVPLVLGATAVALAALIAARTFSRMAGWITGLTLALLPGSFLYTQLGYLDHHAAIALVGTAMLGGAMRVVSSDAAGPRFWPLLAGALCALALSIWAGALLHIAVLQIAMLAWAFGTPSHELSSQRVLRLALAHAVCAAAILPLSLHVWDVFGDFSPLALTRFQPTWYGAGAICLACTVLLWRIPGFSSARSIRLVSAAATGVLGLVLAFATIPGLATILDQSANWFTNDVEFISNIIEIAPLFSSGEQPIWWRPIHFLSGLLFLFPLAMIGVGWRSTRPERWLLLFWAIAFGTLTLSQSRFINTFSISYSIIWGGAISLFIAWTGKRLPTPRARVAAQATVWIAVAVASLLPAWSYYAPRLRYEGYAVINQSRQARIAIARWLGSARPASLDQDGKPDSGLLCVWTAGHELRYYSGRAVNQDGFGPYVSPENTRLASRYYEALNENDAIAILDQMGTRYVVADYLGAGQPPYSKRSMTSRLTQYQGSGTELTTGRLQKQEWLPALTRHRLVYSMANGRGGAWLYEIVTGAVVVGSTTPGSRVTAELRLRSPSGHPRTWTTRQQADENGEFRLRVPYATVGAADSGFTPLGPYTLRSHRGVVEFDVPEAAVHEGATVVAPTLE